MVERDFTHLTPDEKINGIKATKLPDHIRSKYHGEDVREAIAQSTEMAIQLGINMGLSPDDSVLWARKLQEAIPRSEFDSWVATLLDGGPSIFMNTLSELKSTYPNGAPGVALVRETDPAKIYVWNGAAWADFGDYQGLTVNDDSITSNKIANGAVGIDELNKSVTDTLKMESQKLLYSSAGVDNGAIFLYTNMTSTFSGWGSYMGRFKSVNAVELSLRGINPELIPRNIRVLIRLDDYQGDVIYDVTVPMTVNTTAWSTVNVPVVVKNPTGRLLWIEYHTDGRVANETVKGIPDTPGFMRYSVTASLNDLTMRDAYTQDGQNMYVKVYDFDSKVTDELKDAVSESFDFPTSFVDGNIFKSSFNRVFDRTITNKSTGGITELYPTSVFSGWATIMYPTPNKVSSVRIKFKNRELPVTKVKLYITRKDKDGEILAESKESDVTFNDSKPYSEVVVDWHLDTPIDNSNGDYLYLSYQTDQFVNLIASTGPTMTIDITGYGYIAYKTNGLIGEPSGLKYVTSTTSPHYVWYEEYDYHDEYYVPNDRVLSEIGEQFGGITSSVRVVLPDKIDAVVGDNLQLFYRGIVEAVDPYQYDIRVTCAKGRHYHRYFEFLPTSSDIGNHNLHIQVRDNGGEILGEGSTTIKVVAPKSPSTTKNILAIGDSLTSSGTWVQEARRRLMTNSGTPTGNALSNFNFIGTKSDGVTGWEGVGGWTWNSYLIGPSPTTSDIEVFVTSHDKTLEDQKSLWKDSSGNTWELETIEPTKLKFNRVKGNTSTPPTGSGTFTHQSNATHTSTISYTSLQFAGANPFWDAALGRVSFKSYCERNGFSGIDYLYTLLTWNGGRSDKATIEDNLAEVNQAKELIDILHSEYPTAQVRMMGVQLPSLNGGTGTSYGASISYSNIYGLVRGVLGLNLAYQEFANRTGYKNFVKFVNVSSQFDSENLMPETTKPVNNRSALKERIGTNGVHPTAEGYYAIGDVAYRSILGDV